MWYIVYAIKLPNPSLESELNDNDIQYYIPVNMVEKTNPENNNPVVKEEYPLGKLLFVKTDIQISDLVKKIQGLTGVYRDRATGLSATVPEGAMEAFRVFMQDRNNKYLFLRDPYTKFRAHQKVRVIQGDFAGYEGRIVRIRKNRRLVIELGAFAVAIFGIEPSNLEVIED